MGVLREGCCYCCYCYCLLMAEVGCCYCLGAGCCYSLGARGGLQLLPTNLTSPGEKSPDSSSSSGTELTKPQTPSSYLPSALPALQLGGQHYA